MTNDKDFFVPFDIELFKKYCLWIIFKFKFDPHHQQQNSSRGDLIGGFIDRWVNKIPETLIFNKLIDKYSENKYEVINDYFFYKEESAKNAPDILGLKYKNKLYKFATFKKDKWNIRKNAPFVEVKTFRKSQKLITIPSTQFNKNHYYTFVESTVSDLYLLHLFDKEKFLLNEKYFSMFDKYDEFNENDSAMLNYPTDIIKKEKMYKLLDEKYLGGYNLIGIYDGSFIKDYSVEVGKKENPNGFVPEKPRYLYSIEKFDYDDIMEIPEGEFNYFHEEQSIPILLNIKDNSDVFVVKKDESEIILKINGSANIKSIDNKFNEDFEDSFVILKFKNSIHNLTKYYYICNIKKEKNLNFNDGEKIENGILNFYSNEYRNNKFKLINSKNCNFSIFDFSKTTLKFYVEDEVEIKYKKNNENNSEKIKKGFNKINFYKNGSIKSIEHISNNNFEKKFSLNKHDDNPITLTIKFLSENSKIKFIKQNKNNLIFKVEDKVQINSYNDLKTNYYEAKFKNGILQKPKVLDLHPILKGKNKFEPCSDGFYYHRKENGEHNVPVKIYKDKKSYLCFYENKENTIFAEVKGKNVYIDNIDISNNGKKSEVWLLSFKKFDRNSKKNEYVISKNSLFASKKTFEKVLIKEFDNFILNYEVNKN